MAAGKEITGNLELKFPKQNFVSRENYKRGNFNSANLSRASNAGASRDEMNLAEFPLAVLSTRVNQKVKTLEFTDSFRNQSGELIERKWIITGADKFGLPTSTDDDVVLGLIRTSMNQGFRDRKVHFSRYELLKTLRWTTEGRSYSRLVKSLDRLSGVRIRSTNSFYDNSSKSYQTCNFGLIDAYEINDERTSREHKQSFFIWSEALFDSFQAGFVKKLDLDFYFGLKTAASRRLYRFLDKHFYYRSSIEMNLQTLAFEKVGLSRTYQYVSSIRQQLDVALDELCEKGFLSNYEYSGRGEGTSIRINAASNKAVVHHTTAPVSSISAASNQETSNHEPAKNESPKDLINLLVARGINPSQAQKLLNNRNIGDLLKIPVIVSYFDHLLETKDPKISRNPQGFLYRAVETPHKFTIPEEFGKTKEQSTRRLRPEHKVFSRNSFKPEKLKESYSNPNSEIEMEELKKMVEKKVSFLKGVLSAEKYQEAFLGCLKEEIKKPKGA